MLHALANTPEMKILREYSLVVKCVGLEPDSLAGVGTWYIPSSASLSHSEIDQRSRPRSNLQPGNKPSGTQPGIS